MGKTGAFKSHKRLPSIANSINKFLSKTARKNYDTRVRKHAETHNIESWYHRESNSIYAPIGISETHITFQVSHVNRPENVRIVKLKRDDIQCVPQPVDINAIIAESKDGKIDNQNTEYQTELLMHFTREVWYLKRKIIYQRGGPRRSQRVRRRRVRKPKAKKASPTGLTIRTSGPDIQ